MVRVSPRKFNVNTFFPMPAQMGQASATINVPAGTSTGGAGYATTLTADITLPSDTAYVRVNIKPSRTGVTYVGSPVVMFENDATFVAFVSARGNGRFRCTVLITSGFDAPFSTASANNFTFSVVGFRVP